MLPRGRCAPASDWADVGGHKACLRHARLDPVEVRHADHRHHPARAGLLGAPRQRTGGAACARGSGGATARTDREDGVGHVGVALADHGGVHLWEALLEIRHDVADRAPLLERLRRALPHSPRAAPRRAARPGAEVDLDRYCDGVLVARGVLPVPAARPPRHAGVHAARAGAAARAAHLMPSSAASMRCAIASVSGLAELEPCLPQSGPPPPRGRAAQGAKRTSVIPPGGQSPGESAAARGACGAAARARSGLGRGA